eukprot:gene2107-1974_t
MARSSEAFLISAIGAILWFLSYFKSSPTKKLPNSSSATTESDSNFFSFLQDFTKKGGLKNLLGDDSRDTSVQFELISQINCTTSVGRPISVSVRNAGQDRRRMRYFGEGI